MEPSRQGAAQVKEKLAGKGVGRAPLRKCKPIALFRIQLSGHLSGKPRVRIGAIQGIHGCFDCGKTKIVIRESIC
jgi:hypothetical protein